VIKGGLISLVLLAAPCTAIAHSPIKGLNSFYNGLLHPVFVPAHLLLLIAVGLFIGQQGVKSNQFALVSFVIATVIGLIVAWFSVDIEIELFVLVGAAIIGLLIATNPVIGVFWSSLIAATAGFFLGADSTQETLQGKEKFITLLGSGVAIYFLLLYPIALAENFKKKQWLEIGIRVLGSWVAAISLLVLALSLVTK
jgi:hydrogenase/urease accessory protein HupE